MKPITAACRATTPPSIIRVLAGCATTVLLVFGCAKSDSSATRDRDKSGESAAGEAEQTEPGAARRMVPETMVEPVTQPPIQQVVPDPPQPAIRARARFGRLSVLFAGNGADSRPFDDTPGGMPIFLCATDDALFWDDSRGRIWTSSLEGGRPQQIPALGHVTSFACDAKALYYGHENTLIRQGYDDARSELAEVTEHPLLIVPDGDMVYFSAFKKKPIWRVPKAGGKLEKLATASRRVSELVVDDEFLYWTDYGAGTISRGRKSGGGIKILARGQKHPIAVLVDDANIYWGNETTGEIVRMARAGGKSTVLVKDQQNHDFIRLHRGYLYWYSWAGGKYEHQVLRVAVDGGEAEVVVEGLWMPHDLAFSRDRLLILDKGSGHIFALALNESSQ